MPDAVIDSKAKWNRTGIRVTAGTTYRLTASGQWSDASHDCGPDGYDDPKLARYVRWRRFVSAKWFTLIGSVDGRHEFVIGSGTTWKAPASGELRCYANDVAVMYWNNKGSVKLSVEQV
jgi:hypothetical protein